MLETTQTATAREATPYITEQGYLLCASPSRSRASRLFRTTDPVTRGEDWREAKECAQYGEPVPWLGPFHDNLTGQEFWVRPAPCGAGCYCAAQYRLIAPRR